MSDTFEAKLSLTITKNGKPYGGEKSTAVGFKDNDDFTAKEQLQVFEGAVLDSVKQLSTMPDENWHERAKNAGIIKGSHKKKKK